MKAEKIRRNILIFALVVINVGLDQVSKIIVRQYVEYGERTSIMGKFITLTKVENTGAFLGLGQNISPLFYKIIMIGLPLLLLGYGIYYLMTKKDLSKLHVWGISLIIGGGVGNIIDRVIYGSVTDFLHFNFGIFQTGIVNFADMTVTAGFFILIYEYYVKGGRSKLMEKAKGKPVADN